MKKSHFLAAALFCLWQTPQAAANDQMDYLAIENRMQDEWVEYTYSYPQITRGESRVTEQRLNGFLREYSQSTALNARLQAKKNRGIFKGGQLLKSSETTSTFLASYFPPTAMENSCKRALSFASKRRAITAGRPVFLLRFYRNPKNISAGWREEQGISDDFPTLQDFT